MEASHGDECEECEARRAFRILRDAYRKLNTPPRGQIKLDAFDDFWAAYPRKVGKGAARKAWKKIKPSGGLVAVMLTAIAQQKRSTDWRRDGGQFIPHPATWLNQERWKDELPEKKPTNPQANLDPRNQWRDPETGKIWTKIDLEDIANRLKADGRNGVNHEAKRIIERARQDRLQWDWSL
jgi:hypothetical protein